MNLHLRKKCMVLTIFFISFLATNAFAQHTVTGTVTDASTSETLPGVNIQVKGTTTGTSTDSQGHYQLQVPSAADTLVFSFIGFQTQNVPINGRSIIDIEFEPQNLVGEELVVVGYGTQKKESVTSSISSVEGDKVSSAPVSNISNSISGRVPGIISRQASGRPGEDQTNIHIRGVGTTGNDAPLVIVDGIPRDYSEIDPNSIESVTVLKDATAVAPYGVAGANGVILVTTKSGQKGEPTLEYNGYVGIQNPTRLTKFVSSYQYAKMKNEAADNTGTQHPYSDEDLQKFKNCSDPNGHPCSQPIRDVMQNNALRTHHSLQLSGGGDNITYYAGIGFLNQDGMWETTNTKRYNFSANLDAQATKTTDVNIKINSWVQDNNYPASPPEGGGLNSIFYQAFRDPPTSPIHFTNGLWGGYINRSLVGEIYHSGYDHSERTTVQSQITIEQEIPAVTGLSIKGMASYDPTHTTRKMWSTPIPYYSVDTTTDPYTYNKTTEGFSNPQLEQAYSQIHAFTYQASLNYDNSFRKNNIKGLVLAEYRNTRIDTLGASRRGYNLNIDELSVGSSDKNNFDNLGTSSESKQLGFVYRLTYDYDNKYLFEATGRYDGNYYFAPNRRWGYFPAFSIGWRLSEEKFIRDNFSWISNLKLRASWGKSGNLAGRPFQYLSTYGLYGNAYVFGTGETVTQGVFERAEANPFITWEKAQKTNIGLDASLWSDLLNISVDYFFEKRNNMLVEQPNSVPATYGIGLSEVNAGKMINRGIELSVGSSYQFENGLNIDVNANITYAKNKIREIYENPVTYNNPNRRRTGRSLGTKFGLKAIRLFQLSDDENGDGVIDSQDGYNVEQYGTLHPGDIMYKDVNKDGKIDAQDNVSIGKPITPEMTYGLNTSFSYKGFNLDLLFQGAGMADYYLSGELQAPFANAASATVEQLNHWTLDNPDAKYPRVTTAPTQNNTQYSSWWVRNTAYLRLKSGQFSYTLPIELTSNLGIQNVRVYISGENIFTLSKLKNLDPEFGSSNGQYYPQQRVFSLGANITF